MNGLEKPFRKNPIQKIEKKNSSKNQSGIAECEEKPLARKRILVQTVFSLYFKIRVTNFHAAKPLAFSLHFLFWRDQNHYNLTSKIMKSEHMLKKYSAPIHSNSLNCKKPRSPQYNSAQLTALQL